MHRKGVFGALIITALYLISIVNALYLSEVEKEHKAKNLVGSAFSDGKRDQWTGTYRNVLWLRSDSISDPNAYYLDVESRVQVPGYPEDNGVDNAVVNSSCNSEGSAVTFIYPRLNSTAPFINSPYKSGVTPHVELWVNSLEKKGRIITCSIEFDMNGDGTSVYKAQFGTYRTRYTYQQELAVIPFTGWEGGNEPTGQMTNGVVRLRIWRLDNVTESNGTLGVQIYCGFHNRTSWIGVPFDVPDVMPVADIGPQGFDLDHMGYYWEGQDPIYFEFPVTLDGSNSSDPQGQSLMYKWTITNMDPRYSDVIEKVDWSANPKATFTFHVPLAEAHNRSYETNFSVELQVRDPDNHYDQDIMTYHLRVIEDRAPIINMTAVDISTPATGQTLTFTCTAYDPDDSDNEMEFKWDFDDGSETQYVELSKGGNVVTHKYTTAGTYTVTVWVRDKYPKTATDQYTIEVVDNQAPEPAITVLSSTVDTDTIPGEAIANLYQNIKVSSAETSDDALPKMRYDTKLEHRLYYRWYTGQGDTYDSDTTVIDPDDENKDGDGWITSTTFSFNYSAPSPTGYYELKLEVADGDPDEDPDGIVKTAINTMKVWVNRAPNPVIKYSPNIPEGIERNMEVTFYANETTDPDDYDSLDNMYFRWEFGDGGKAEGYGKYVVTHKYTEEISPQDKFHMYNVKLTVYDSHQAMGTAEITIKIVPENLAPIAKATVGTPTKDEGVTEKDVKTLEEFGLYGYTSFDQDLWGGAIASYAWDLNAEVDSDGDGIPDNDVDREGKNITYYYTKPGTYKINLIVTDNKGVTSTLYDDQGYYLEIRVYNQAPVAKLRAVEGTELKVGDVVNLDATDSYDPDNSSAKMKGIREFQWDYDGDGVADNSTYNGKSTYTFKKAGTYVIAVIVVDSEGDTNRTTVTIVVTGSDNKNGHKEKGIIPGFEFTYTLISITAVALAMAVASFVRRKGRV